MKTPGFLHKSDTQNLHFLIILSAMIILLAIGLAVVKDYGIASDERADILSVYWNVRLIKSGKPIPETREFYGVFFPLTAETIYQAWKLLSTGQLNIPSNIEDDEIDLSGAELRERINIKHPYTFVFSLLAYLAVAGIVGILAGFKYAWLGVAVLAFIPRFWGHSFFNPKDIPFATMFTIGTLIGSILIGHYSQLSKQDLKIGFNRTTLYTVMAGLMFGIVTSTRVAGALLLLNFFGVHVFLVILRKFSLREYLRFTGQYGLLFVAWLSMLVLFQPASWHNPFRWLTDAFISLSSYSWEGANLFMGQLIPAQHIPWYYLPVWLGITIPEAIQFFFLIGAIILFINFFRLTQVQQACALLVLLQIALLPGIAILRNSTIYDGMRQFLFILPAVGVIAATAIASILQRLVSMHFRIAAYLVLIGLTIPILTDMYLLHPYEYVYFNRTFGGLERAHNQFDTDYWGLSMREAMEWVNTHAEPGTLVVTSRPYISSETFASSDIITERLHLFDEKVTPRPYYVMILSRFEAVFGGRFANCDVMYKVTKQGVALTSVRECR